MGAGDLDRTEAFYTAVIGTRRTMSFNLQFREYVVQAPGGGPALALMHWVDGSPRNYRDNLGKLVFTVSDAAAASARVTAAGGQVVQPALDGVAIAKDLDGTVIELRQR